MEQNNHKFRLRLNLFDAVILVLALAVGAVLVLFGLRSGGASASPNKGSGRSQVLVRPRSRGCSRWPTRSTCSRMASS